MTDTPIWPGVAEYLYHAASSARVLIDGTRIVPFGLTARCSSFECTPMAAAPAMMRMTPASPAARARRLTSLLGGGAYPACGQDMTTRNPAMRRQSLAPDMVTSLLPRGVVLA